MREIKFRVWDKQNEVFIQSCKLCDIAESSNGAHSYYYGSIDNKKVTVDVVLQQFTGLLDKNGREIYEGDILKVKGYDSWNDKVGFYYKSQVFYCAPLARFRHSVKNFDNVTGTDFDFNVKDDIEAIGNVFENPALITDK